MVFVFDLGLRERRLLDDAPHHRLRAAIEQPARDEFEDFPGDLRFGRIAHRRVGMIPVANDAEPLEFLPLHGEPVFGIGAAFLAEGDDGLRIREVGLRPCPCFGRILPRPSIRSAARDSPSRARSWIPGPSSDASGRQCLSASCSAPCRCGHCRWRKAARRGGRISGGPCRSRAARHTDSRAPSEPESPAPSAADRRAWEIRLRQIQSARIIEA